MTNIIESTKLLTMPKSVPKQLKQTTQIITKRMTHKFKPTNRQQQQQQQQMNPALARAEKKLNEQTNKQMTTITYSNNNY